jgi:hypothetical protein
VVCCSSPLWGVISSFRRPALAAAPIPVITSMLATGTIDSLPDSGSGSTGSLSVLTNSPYNNGVAVISSAITPGNTFLYAGTSSGIFIYAINGDGSITVQNGGSIAEQDVIPTAMQVDGT